jgi:hypothetical protein
MLTSSRAAPRALVMALASLGAAAATQAAPPAATPGQGAEHARIVEHWTPARRAAAIPRDLVIDERGYGYMKLPGGQLQPYGHSIAATAGAQRPMARPAPGDTTGPMVTINDPGVGATVTTTAYSFKATVTDLSGVRSVSFRVGPKNGVQTSFNAAAGANGVYTVNLTGLTDGAWTWSVVAKDNANITTTTALTEFKVQLGSGGGGGGGSNGTVVTNAAYNGGGAIQNAVGRIYFEMPSNSRRTRWAGYVCSGTVVTDGANNGRSVIQTAAHCVYDDAYKAYARNVLFIPNQDGTIGTGTDRTCSNDPLGCWTPWFGVVDANWTTRTFPDNIPWDYAYYVVRDTGAHEAGITTASEALDVAVAPVTVNFVTPPEADVASSAIDYTAALGYSYSNDPNFMYCAEDLSQYDSANWLLASCGLSGGSSGGPWMQPFTGGGVNDRLISVNSWGYTNQPGMYGPKLSGTSASCVFNQATNATVTTTVDGNEGSTANCP